MVGEGAADNPRANAMFEKAKAAEDSGRTGKAIKLYDELADEIPYADRAGEARYRQAQLLEKEGEAFEAFEAYQDLLKNKTGSGFYQQALDRQTQLAFGAADGEIKKRVLGLKARASTTEVVKMLNNLAGNAPRSPVAARASLKVAEIYESEDKTSEAVKAYQQVVVNYPNSPEAPEAQFRIGQALLGAARDGNQDQANLQRASESFRDYLNQYPGHKRNGEARKLLKNIDGRDVQNTYEIAQFYEKKGNKSSARFYYQEVVRKTKSGDLHDRAQARLNALGGDN